MVQVNRVCLNIIFINRPQSLVDSNDTAQGVKNASDIVYLKVFPQSGIAQTNSAKVVAGQRYYNVTGQQSDKPFAGMDIVVRTYTDGTTSTSKAIY